MRFTAVTVYKRIDGGWKRLIFDRAVVRGISSRTRRQNGDYKSSELCARIFSANAAEIAAGDKLMTGACSGAVPDTEKALTVYEISDNTCIGRPHFRISAR